MGFLSLVGVLAPPTHYICAHSCCLFPSCLLCVRLTQNIPWNPGWHQSPTSVSRLLGLQTCATISGRTGLLTISQSSWKLWSCWDILVFVVTWIWNSFNRAFHYWSPLVCLCSLLMICPTFPFVFDPESSYLWVSHPHCCLSHSGLKLTSLTCLFIWIPFEVTYFKN